MSVLKKYFDKSVKGSPVMEDFKKVVNVDELGEEFITWEKIDYPKIQKENGRVADWNLNNLLKAGINPNFPIHTGLNTRIEGIDVVNKAASIADSILSENKDVKE